MNLALPTFWACWATFALKEMKEQYLVIACVLSAAIRMLAPKTNTKEDCHASSIATWFSNNQVVLKKEGHLPIPDSQIG